MNRKIYRHKPTGELFRQTNTLEIRGMESMESDGLTLPIWLVEQSDDWEEVKEESNYLITAFRSTKDKSLARINALGLYDFGIPLKDLLHGENSIEDGKWEIYSVKNSKGEEFTIGDKFSNGPKKTGFIKGFKTPDVDVNAIYFSEEDSFCYTNLDHVTKVKYPIYTTTDGVDIYEGDYKTVYLINKEQPSDECKVCAVLTWSKEDSKVADRYLTFTSEENRDKYIKENTKKPVFVSADGKDMYEGDLTFSVLSRNTWEEKRIRVNNFITAMHKDWIHFRTKEARQEYIDNNKPRFSLADIEKAYNNTQSPTTSPLFQNFKSELKKLGK